MRTALLTTLALVLGACAGDAGSAQHADLSIDADAAEVLATSEATVEIASSESDLGFDPEIEPGADELVEPGPEAAGKEEVGPTARFDLRRGETLAHYARWSGVPVEDIAEISELDLEGVYPVGTEIVVPVNAEELAVLTTKRDAHHAACAEAWLASRGGSSGSAFVKVRTGDTAWSIAKDAGSIPVWLLESYNPSVDLERLRPGQQLMIPVLTEGTVAEAEEVSLDEVEAEMDGIEIIEEIPSAVREEGATVEVVEP